MKRPLETASGIGVFAISVISSMAVFKTFFDFQKADTKIPLVSIISLGATGLAVLLSFIGAFILLSWSGRSK